MRIISRLRIIIKVLLCISYTVCFYQMGEDSRLYSDKRSARMRRDSEKHYVG